MIRVLGLTVGLLVATAAATAGAASAAGISGPERARQAQCVAKASPQATRQLLALVPTSADERDAGEALLRRTRGCSRNLLREAREGDVLVETRGLLAEQLLVGQPLPEMLPARGTRRFVAMELNRIEELGANRATLVFYDTAACAMDRDWAGARTLLGSGHGSPEEGEALRALQPSFAACLNGVRKMVLPPLLARAAIAEEAWHRLNGAQIADVR